MRMIITLIILVGTVTQAVGLNLLSEDSDVPFFLDAAVEAVGEAAEDLLDFSPPTMIGWIDPDELTNDQLRRAARIGGRLVCRQVGDGAPRHLLGLVDDDEQCVNRNGTPSDDYYLMFVSIDTKLRWVNPDSDWDGSVLRIGDQGGGSKMCMGANLQNWGHPWKDLGYVHEGLCHTMREGERSTKESYQVLKYRLAPRVGKRGRVKQLIEEKVVEYAPVLLFHEEESYFPTSARDFANKAMEVEGDKGWGLELTAENYANGVEKGDLSKATAYVNVKIHNSFIDLQYWYFFAFNREWIYTKKLDFGSFRYVPIGDYPTPMQLGWHDGDWQCITVRITRDGDFSGVYYEPNNEYNTREDGAWHEGETLGRVRAYVARDSHGLYPETGRFYKKLLVDSGYEVRLLYDVGSSGKSFDSRDNLKILSVQKYVHYERAQGYYSVNGQFDVQEPDWMKYEGSWGRGDLGEVMSQLLRIPARVTQATSSLANSMSRSVNIIQKIAKVEDRISSLEPRINSLQQRLNEIEGQGKQCESTFTDAGQADDLTDWEGDIDESLEDEDDRDFTQIEDELGEIEAINQEIEGQEGELEEQKERIKEQERGLEELFGYFEAPGEFPEQYSVSNLQNVEAMSPVDGSTMAGVPIEQGVLDLSWEMEVSKVFEFVFSRLLAPAAAYAQRGGERQEEMTIVPTQAREKVEEVRTKIDAAKEKVEKGIEKITKAKQRLRRNQPAADQLEEWCATNPASVEAMDAQECCDSQHHGQATKLAAKLKGTLQRMEDILKQTNRLLNRVDMHMDRMDKAHRNLVEMKDYAQAWFENASGRNWAALVANEFVESSAPRAPWMTERWK